jgi:glycosyltransferase involved in cell wall biosynthesis
VRSVSALCEALAAEGHSVTVATTNQGLPAAEYPTEGRHVRRQGVAVHYFGSVGLRQVRILGLEDALPDLIAACDIVHVTSIWQRCAFPVHRAARRVGRPVIVSPRGALGPYAWAKRRWLKMVFHFALERPYLKQAAGFHFTAEQERAESARYCGGRPHVVIPNGIDAVVWRHDANGRSTVRARLELQPSTSLLLYAGRLHHKKGLDLLPAVLTHLTQRCQGDFQLVLVGPDEDGTGARLRQELAARGLTGRVRQLRTQSEAELRELYSAADVFVLPSHHENFGNAAIEALACGCPGVVSTETACLEFAHDLGLVGVSGRQPEAWAAAITAALNHRRPAQVQVTTLRNRIGLRATATQMVNFYNKFIQ